MSIQDKFSRLSTDNAPGQQVRQGAGNVATLLRGDSLPGTPVDFSHGDVDAHTPTPGAFEFFAAGVQDGGKQAYTEYRGDLGIRELIGPRLAAFTGTPVNARDGLIVTPGSQGALFLAVAACVTRGDKVAIVQPDYFANRKLVEFFEGQILPVQLEYAQPSAGVAGLNLDQLEAAFRAGARVFVFSNPNNPTGVVYSPDEIRQIATLAVRYGATVIVDQLYSRLQLSDLPYTHLRAQDIDPEAVVTIMGPSKTESLSGYRLGVGFGSKALVGRMEKLQAIVSLRAAGYSQAVLRTWFNEPAGWMEERIRQHRLIRDDLLNGLRSVRDIAVRTPEAGSYLFPRLPKLAVPPAAFVTLLRMQAGVIVTPGTEFSPHTADSIRLNFSQDRTAATAAVGRLCSLIERYRA
ncbi:MAG: pyridoxal phosphate-dependent aminotransferase [Opitutaceae bacterium]|nr:pyridoxal phosphate-dependent aminotransferase [Opitutaceae bacterium]